MNICGKYGTKNRILISIVLLLSLLFPAPLLSSAPETQANKPPQNAVKISLEEYLLEAVRRPTGETAFHFAAQACCMPCILPLLKSGADPHAPNKDKQTPLSVACPEAKHLIQTYQQKTQRKRK